MESLKEINLKKVMCGVFVLFVLGVIGLGALTISSLEQLENQYKEISMANISFN